MERSTKPAPSERPGARSSASVGALTRPRQASSSTLAEEPERRVAPAASLTQVARQASAVLSADERRLAAQTLAQLAREAEAGTADGLESWLGPAPSNPVALELGALKQRFALRRQVLSQIGRAHV